MKQARTPAWRSMAVADLAAVIVLAGQVHPDYPEGAAVFAERLALHSAGCLVLPGARGLLGYALSHPWRGPPPPLDTLLGALPTPAETYYWHDLALLPAARGLGVGRAALALLAAEARRLHLPDISLVAVGEAAGFWRHLGFQSQPSPAASSYGAGAQPMRLAL